MSSDSGSKYRYTRAELLDALREWVDEHGRPPTAVEAQSPDTDLPVKHTYQRRFGTWNKALHAAGLELNQIYEIPIPVLEISGHYGRIPPITYDALGEPDALRAFVRGDQVALIPANPDHPNAYPLTSAKSGHRISVGWLKSALARDTQPEGYYRLVEDDVDGIWTVDFSPDGRGKPSLDELLGTTDDGDRGDSA